MKIKLIQTGGILPITKVATIEVNWTSAETDALLKNLVGINKDRPSQIRDGIEHILEIDGKELSVDVSKAEGKFAAVFSELKSKLKIVKT